ncbi:MAG: L,D-transpeptidase [Nannocystaceae bacterium]|nr:L,D-transpeptidase [bacterium]
MKRSFSFVALCALAIASCSSASAEQPEAGAKAETSENDVLSESERRTVVLDEEGGETGEEPDEFAPAPDLVDGPAPARASAPEPALDVEPESEPIGRRIARQQLTVYAKPTSDAPIRGRIPMAAAFDVHGYVEGPGCEGELGWADLGHHGYACMTNTRKGDGANAYALPKMRAQLTPFFYAKAKANDPAPIFKNLRAARNGDAPVGTMKKGVDYAFKIRRRVDGQVYLIDGNRRAVREKDVRRFQPSRFEGRDLEAEPVPEGKVLAWASNWPEAAAYSRASQDSELAAQVGYHEQLLLEPADTDGWYKLSSGAFISASDVRVFAAPTERPPEVGAGDIWIDVDLEQQVLSVMLGDEAIFATMVSSGLKSPTPRGLFRIRNKLAVGSMSSSPGADDFYDVQAVPHVQYFLGSFALHSAYWHNGFGRPISHGCVNLSPKDAQRVFSLTTPKLPAGWIHGYESTEHLGTTVRIHKGDQPVRDRRKEVDPVYGI